MSLFSTITHGQAPGLKGISPRGIGTFALILAAGMALGYAVSTIDFAVEAEVPVYESLSHGEFLRLNTTDLEWLEPMVEGVTVPQTQPVVEVDQFTWANIGSYAALNEPWTVDTEFTEVNTQMLVYRPVSDNTIPFIAMNVGSYGALIEGWEMSHEVDAGFLEVNTNLGSTYTAPTSGPR